MNVGIAVDDRRIFVSRGLVRMCISTFWIVVGRGGIRNQKKFKFKSLVKFETSSGDKTVVKN